MHRSTVLGSGALLIALVVATAAAAATPEARCQSSRYAAAAKYAQCEQKAVAAYYASGNGTDYESRAAKCNVKYQAMWSRIEGQASGTLSHCDHPRFMVLAGGTVRDNLTGLEWEQKTDDGGIHDVDDTYAWSAPHEFVVPADGTAFTSFLATLNGGSCFAGQCDWRLPTRAELQTILLAPFPCATDPCIDQAIFGPTASYFHWTSTTRANQWNEAWSVGFMNGVVSFEYKDESYFIRAVRGGL